MKIISLLTAIASLFLFQTGCFSEDSLTFVPMDDETAFFGSPYFGSSKNSPEKSAYENLELRFKQNLGKEITLSGYVEKNEVQIPEISMPITLEWADSHQTTEVSPDSLTFATVTGKVANVPSYTTNIPYFPYKLVESTVVEKKQISLTDYLNREYCESANDSQREDNEKDNIQSVSMILLPQVKSADGDRRSVLALEPAGPVLRKLAKEIPIALHHVLLRRMAQSQANIVFTGDVLLSNGQLSVKKILSAKTENTAHYFRESNRGVIEADSSLIGGMIGCRISLSGRLAIMGRCKGAPMSLRGNQQKSIRLWPDRSMSHYRDRYDGQDVLSQNEVCVEGEVYCLPTGEPILRKAKIRTP